MKKKIPAVTEVYCDVCGVKRDGDSRCASVTFKESGNAKHTYDLCDKCAVKVDTFLRDISGQDKPNETFSEQEPAHTAL